LPVSVVSGTGMVAETGSRGALERPPAGLSDVRSEEKVAGPVIERGRVKVLEVEVRALRARDETRAVDMAVVVLMVVVLMVVVLGYGNVGEESSSN
jgi:hypothetical protein